jgi:hypothetical protein
MHFTGLPTSAAFISFLSVTPFAIAEEPKLAGVGSAMQEMIAKNEVAGAVTVVVSKEKTLHLETTGFADVASKKPMSATPSFGSPP